MRNVELNCLVEQRIEYYYSVEIGFKIIVNLLNTYACSGHKEKGTGKERERERNFSILISCVFVASTHIPLMALIAKPNVCRSCPFVYMLSFDIHFLLLLFAFLLRSTSCAPLSHSHICFHLNDCASIYSTKENEKRNESKRANERKS